MPSTESIRSIVHIQVPLDFTEEQSSALRKEVQASIDSGRPYPVVVTPEGVVITTVQVDYQNDILDFPFDSEEEEGSSCCP